MKIPQHAGSFSIEHNPHTGCYQSVAEYFDVLRNLHALDDDDFPSAEAKQRCLDTGELWLVRWYPATPVGFVTVYAPTLKEALEHANRDVPTVDVELPEEG